MEKKWLILIVIVIVLAIVVLFLSIQNKNNDRCRTINQFNIASCYAEKAIKNNNLTYCDELNDEIDNSNCYLIIAYNTSNPDICNNIKNDTFQSDCIYGYIESKRNMSASSIFGKADVSVLNKEICNKIRSIQEKSRCLRKLANLDENISICYDIAYNLEKQYCLNNLNSTASLHNNDNIIFNCSDIDTSCNLDNMDTEKISTELKSRCIQLCTNISRESNGYSFDSNNLIIKCACY